MSFVQALHEVVAAFGLGARKPSLRQQIAERQRIDRLADELDLDSPECKRRKP